MRRETAADARFAQRVGRDRRIPDRREAGLEEERLAVVDDQVLELPHGFHAHGRVLGIAQNIERHDRVLHRRIDGAEAVGVLHALEHPVLALADGGFADARETVPVPELEDLVGLDEGLAPAQPGIVALESGALAGNEDYTFISWNTLQPTTRSHVRPT